MALGKIYKNCSSLTTPPAIQGPEVSAFWRRTSRGEVLMTVWMPQDTVNSEVYVKTPRGHFAVNMDPWTSSTWRKPWKKHHTPNKVTKDKLNRFTQQETHWGISLNRTSGRQGWSRGSNWSPRPNKDHNLRAFGLISGPCTSPSPRQQKLNKVRKEEASPNPRKRAREATPFTPHDTSVVISSDEEEEQDKISPSSPPDQEKGHPAVYEYQPKSPAYPPPSDQLQMKTLAVCLTWRSPAGEMSPVSEWPEWLGVWNTRCHPCWCQCRPGQLPGQGHTGDPSPSPRRRPE